MKNRTHGKKLVTLTCALALTGLSLHANVTHSSPVQLITESTSVDRSETLSNDADIDALPDKLNTLSDTLTHDLEVKHYSFISQRGQQVLINPINYDSTGSPWLIEYKTDARWITHHSSEPYVTPALIPGTVVELKVSKKPQHSTPSGAHYEIEFGSAPRLIDNDISGDVDHFNIYFGKYRAYRTFNWKTRVVDYTGKPLEGVKVTLELNIDQDASTAHIVSYGISNVWGLVRTSFGLPECQGRTTADPFWLFQYGARRQWQLTYNPGYWFMYPDSNEKGGVGSRNGEKSSFVHVCSQRIIR